MITTHSITTLCKSLIKTVWWYFPDTLISGANTVSIRLLIVHHWIDICGDIVTPNRTHVDCVRLTVYSALRWWLIIRINIHWLPPTLVNSSRKSGVGVLHVKSQGPIEQWYFIAGMHAVLLNVLLAVWVVLFNSKRGWLKCLLSWILWINKL